MVEPREGDVASADVEKIVAVTETGQDDDAVLVRTTPGVMNQELVAFEDRERALNVGEEGRAANDGTVEHGDGTRQRFKGTGPMTALAGIGDTTREKQEEEQGGEPLSW